MQGVIDKNSRPSSRTTSATPVTTTTQQPTSATSASSTPADAPIAQTSEPSLNPSESEAQVPLETTAPAASEAEPEPAPPPPPPLRIPRFWPKDVQFIIDYTLSEDLNLSSLPPVSQDQITKHNLQLLNPKPYAAPHAHIQPITDPKHPAHGQNGLFASRDLGNNTHIVDYVGQVISADSPQIKTSDYVLDFGGGGEGCVILRDDGTEDRLSIDGGAMGNEGRMVNDFRGVPLVVDYSKKSYAAGKKKGSDNPAFAMWANKSKPNVEFRSYVNRSEEGNGEMRMGLFVCVPEGVKAGRELLISYGKGYWKARGLSDMGEMYQELLE
ncbi:hypothetical protein HDU79_006510 [Rhizoclosmatium sp. JEL0117]|nr:hypothetical protein HDU79_006510 [Rhizoclosmatium sp. JEL0117]